MATVRLAPATRTANHGGGVDGAGMSGSGRGGGGQGGGLGRDNVDDDDSFDLGRDSALDAEACFARPSPRDNGDTAAAAPGLLPFWCQQKNARCSQPCGCCGRKCGCCGARGLWTKSNKRVAVWNKRTCGTSHPCENAANGSAAGAPCVNDAQQFAQAVARDQRIQHFAAELAESTAEDGIAALFRSPTPSPRSRSPAQEREERAQARSCSADASAGAGVVDVGDSGGGEWREGDLVLSFDAKARGERYFMVKNVVGSTGDKSPIGKCWRDFIEAHYAAHGVVAGKFPEVCRMKDCDRKAVVGGHMWARDVALPHGHVLLLPICVTHNASGDANPLNTRYLPVKATGVAVVRSVPADTFANFVPP